MSLRHHGGLKWLGGSESILQMTKRKWNCMYENIVNCTLHGSLNCLLDLILIGCQIQRINKINHLTQWARQSCLILILYQNWHIKQPGDKEFNHPKDVSCAPVAWEFIWPGHILSPKSVMSHPGAGWINTREQFLQKLKAENKTQLQ